MSDFFHPMTEQASRKQRQCIYCGEEINKGDVYARQTGVFDGRWQDNKYHPECFSDFCDQGDGEFTPYSNDRPEKASQP
jgi:hypothetical protein